MVRVPGAATPSGELDDFFLDRYEVTNREYKAFIDAGGYRNQELWKQEFAKDGKILAWEDGIRELVDQTGQPGPATWEAGDYPEGQEDYPVSGVSWYEAAAYAEFMGRSLPTDAHWLVARGTYTPVIQYPQLGGMGLFAPASNFNGSGPVPVGSLPSLGAYGTFDLSGNVREWCLNEAPQGRVIRGGAWEDNPYMFGVRSEAPPLDRSQQNGFRLAYLPELQRVPAEVFLPQAPPAVRDFYRESNVPDAVFEVFKEQFEYDDAPLNARLISREESPHGWIREKVSFDAAYGEKRVTAYLHLPRNATPPYQTVIYFPGTQPFYAGDKPHLDDWDEFLIFASFLVKNGRAVLYPAYQGTFDRGDPDLYTLHVGNGTRAYSEYLIQVVRDFMRSVDYVESRPDLDAGRIAYYGLSWGARMGAVIPAVEDRIRASVLLTGGLDFRPARKARPEADDRTYVTRVRVPTLMLNGRYDVIWRLEEGILPMFDLLGTPPEDKRLILYDTDHIPPRAEFIKETLAWLDKYLGPVRR